MIPEKIDETVFKYDVPAFIKRKDKKNGEEQDFPTGIKSGVIYFLRPTFSEKYDYLEKCGLKFDEEGNSGFESNFKASVKAVECSVNHFLHVDIEKDDGEKIDSVKKMLYDPDCSTILFEIGSMLIRGFGVSKNPKP